MPTLQTLLSRWRRGSAAVLALPLCLTSFHALTQPVTEAAVKAGFVFNFIKFTQWPSGRDGSSAPIRLCAASPLPLDGQLLLLQGRNVGGRLIEVQTGVPPGEWRQCDVLFLGQPDVDRLPMLQQRLAQAPVLTVGDVPGFLEAGGMMGLRTEASRVRFDVNLNSAQASGLVLNSQMLMLAGKVVQ